jgi:TRAP-type C4-dicarboxylate transport system permease small subunit
MTVIIGWQVWGRYVLNDSPQWTERLSLLLMLYYILLAAAVGVRDRFHLGLVFFQQALPAKVRWAVDILVNVIVGAFGLFMVWYGVKIALSTWTHTIPTLGIPTGAGYLPFPIAGVLIVLFSLEHILVSLARRGS